MPDISMCANGHCGLSKQCYRHEDSGTKPTEHRQAYSYFHGSWDAGNNRWSCDDYIPVTLKAVK